MTRKHWLPVVAVAAFTLAACPPPEEPPVDEVPPAVEEPPEVMVPVQEQIQVMNTMDEPLHVYAIIRDREERLGTVEANETATFTITAEPGTRVEIEARDAEGDVVESETIDIEREPRPAPRDWRIERTTP